MMGSKKDNPWILIWTRPNYAWPSILCQSNSPSIPLLGMLAGASLFFILFSQITFFSIPLIIALTMLVGSLAGLINLYFFSTFLKWSGRWLGSTAGYTEMRIICAWATPPLFCNLLLWTIGRNFPAADSAFLFVSGILCIWSFAVLVSGVKAASSFSTWRAISTAAIAGAATLIVYVTFTGALLLGHFQGYKQSAGSFYHTGVAVSGR